MELVIKIPEEAYKLLKNKGVDWLGAEHILNAVADGTPLPKGHGRIGDLDALEEEMMGGIKAGNHEDGYSDYPHINNMDDCVDCVRYADAIIEADKEGKESDYDLD